MARGLAAALAVLALLAAGCGSDSRSSTVEREHYRAQVTQISGRFGQAGQAFRDSVGPGTTPKQAAAALRTFQRRVLGAAVALERLRPPPEVERPHRDLARAFRDIARAAQPSIDAGRRDDGPALRRALERLSRQLSGPLGERARAAAAEIDRRLAKPG